MFLSQLVLVSRNGYPSGRGTGFCLSMRPEECPPALQDFLKKATRRTAKAVKWSQRLALSAVQVNSSASFRAIVTSLSAAICADICVVSRYIASSACAKGAAWRWVSCASLELISSKTVS